ncbi:hypothetical protein [Paraflavitalea sp. CAU 1676]|uniref:hypothetical protein n=1 Tax=Paraflavitalea sp. CAU 1676 TaxID=3032598 RepID=UPI0023DA23A3|nr:hypothetical protein [Paraflavitalea sp. CAU 1676]
MPAAPAAIPPKPKIAAMTAITRKMIEYRSIDGRFIVNNREAVTKLMPAIFLQVSTIETWIGSFVNYVCAGRPMTKIALAAKIISGLHRLEATCCFGTILINCGNSEIPVPMLAAIPMSCVVSIGLYASRW